MSHSLTPLCPLHSMSVLPSGHLKLSDMGLCKKVDFDEMLSDGASVHRYAAKPSYTLQITDTATPSSSLDHSIPPHPIPVNRKLCPHLSLSNHHLLLSPAARPRRRVVKAGMETPRRAPTTAATPMGPTPTATASSPTRPSARPTTSRPRYGFQALSQVPRALVVVIAFRLAPSSSPFESPP